MNLPWNDHDLSRSEDHDTLETADWKPIQQTRPAEGRTRPAEGLKNMATEDTIFADNHGKVEQEESEEAKLKITMKDERKIQDPDGLAQELPSERSTSLDGVLLHDVTVCFVCDRCKCGQGAFLGPSSANDAGPQDEARSRCEMLLEQALSCSKLTDVRFVFDDGRSDVSGHWAMLCGVCKVFEAMNSCGMEEARTREIRVVGVSRESFLAFLEWLYLGGPGAKMNHADGREVWLLAERYQIDGIKEWLIEDSIDDDNLFSVAQYASEGDGERRDELLMACRAMSASIGTYHGSDDGEFIRGVSAGALQQLLEGNRSGGYGLLEGERAMNRFRIVKLWAKENQVPTCDAKSQEEISGLIDAVDLSKLPLQFIANVVRPSGLVSVERLMDVMIQHPGNFSLGDVLLDDCAKFGSKGEGAGQFLGISHIGISVGGQGQRLAVADSKKNRVVVFDVESTEFVMNVGSVGDGPGQFRGLRSVVFNKQGGLVVGDSKLNRIQIFDREGVHVRGFGSQGVEDGQLNRLSGIALNHQGDIIVCDSGNCCVKIFREDGTFICKFGSKGTGAGQFESLVGVAVRPDGSIVVVDQGNARVQVFSPLGSHMMTIGSKGAERGQFLKPHGVGVGLMGEIVVSDWERKDLQVFSQAGKFMQTVGEHGNSFCEIMVHNGLAVDDLGRIFVGDLAEGRLSVIMLQAMVSDN